MIWDMTLYYVHAPTHDPAGFVCAHQIVRLTRDTSKCNSQDNPAKCGMYDGIVG